MQMHYGQDFDVIVRFSKQQAIREARHTAFADILLNNTEEQRVVLDSHQRAFDDINKSKSQAFLFAVVIMSGAQAAG